MNTIVQKQFNGGVSDSIRDKNSNVFGITKNFDILTDKHKLIPVRGTELDSSSSVKSSQLTDFIYASNSYLFGLGNNGTTGYFDFWYKTSADTPSGSWRVGTGSSSNSFIGGSVTEFLGYLWFFSGNNKLSKLNISSFALTESLGSLSSISTVANGIVMENNLYLAYNNVVVMVDSSGNVYNDVFSAIPSDEIISSLTDYGSYLAIATYSGKSSKVYLWDLLSDNATEIIDWGNGYLKIIENIEGYLVGVSDYYSNSLAILDEANVFIKIYSGGFPRVYKKLKVDSFDGQLLSYKAKRNNRLYWWMSVNNADGTTTYGIWEFGRNNINDSFALTCYLEEQNIGTYDFSGFGIVQGYFFISLRETPTTKIVRRTNDQAVYAYTSIIETQEYQDDDLKTMVPKILRVNFEPIPSGSSIVAKYKKNGASSWTTLFTASTEGATYKETNLSGECDYIQFRLESIGATITGISFSYDTKNSMI